MFCVRCAPAEGEGFPLFRSGRRWRYGSAEDGAKVVRVIEQVQLGVAKIQNLLGRNRHVAGLLVFFRGPIGVSIRPAVYGRGIEVLVRILFRSKGLVHHFANLAFDELG